MLIRIFNKINGKNWPVYNEVWGRRSHSNKTANRT